MGWRRFAGGCCAAIVLSACGGGAAATPPTPEPAAAAPSSVPSVTRSPAASPAVATASPVAPRPTSTAAAAAKPTTVWVGNTDGEGVFIRKTPVMTDKVNAYADGTPLTIVGDDVDGDGQHWKHVRTPDGVDGYVPAMYTVDTQP